MDRSDKAGFGIAIVGHAILLAALTLGLVARPKPPVVMTDPVDVQIVDEVGLVSGAPKPATEAPATSQAPEQGRPEEAAAAPEDAPAPPEPTSPPPAPEPIQKPKVKPKPVSEPVPTPEPSKPTPPKPVSKPAPKPVAKPAEKPAPEKPTPKAKPEKATPAKATPAKAAPAKAAPAKSAPAKSSGAGTPAKSSATTAKDGTAKAGAGKGKKTSGDLLGDDFLKGISPEKSASKAQAPRAATISATQMAGLVGAIQRQFIPCANRRSAPGPGSNRITTRLRLQFNKDGSLSAAPVVLGQLGTDDENARYATRVGEMAVGIARECSPVKLPPELYDIGNGQGWNDIVIRYKLPG